MKLYQLGFALLLTGGILAFTPAKEKPLNQTFRYIGPSVNPQYHIPGNWEPSDLTPCPTEGTIKCLVTPNSSSITDEFELADEILANGFANITTNDTKS
ncbi:hypothetical protein [Flavihumibacter sp. UBA7668]|uniref:hypothetical protein n=1 Tax=Flavihumibacter sp. UBA7668 TaxID=1946542 RepID=UPI0025BC54FC|nr:hypothetical protein [Flavihumibacter sp. UBA7668]